MLSGWGILKSFWSVLVFSSAFFRRFFRGTVCLGSFVFPGAFLAFFSRKNWRLFAVTLRCYPTRVCWPVRPWLFKFFRMPPTRLTLNNRSADLLPAPSTSALPFFEVFVAVFQQLLRAPRFRFRTKLQSLWPTLFIDQSCPTFVAAFRAEILTARFPAWLFPWFQRCFSSVVSRVCFQLCLGCCQLVFLQLQVP